MSPKGPSTKGKRNLSAVTLLALLRASAKKTPAARQTSSRRGRAPRT